MIARIVHLFIDPQFKEDFLQMIETKKTDIRNAQGCCYLNLLHMDEDKSCFHVVTFSHWNTQEDLEKYKESNVFGEVWPQTKKWFVKKPEAQSYAVLDNVG